MTSSQIMTLRHTVVPSNVPVTGITTNGTGSAKISSSIGFMIRDILKGGSDTEKVSHTTIAVPDDERRRSPVENSHYNEFTASAGQVKNAPHELLCRQTEQIDAKQQEGKTFSSHYSELRCRV